MTDLSLKLISGSTYTRWSGGLIHFLIIQRVMFMNVSTLILGICLSLIPCLVTAQELKIEKKGVFMGAPYELVEFPNGAWANKSLMTDYRMFKVPLSSNFVKKEVVKIADGIYTINGLYAGYVPVIETSNGVIIYDTGTNPEIGREILRLLETVTKKPVIAVIYSHSHYIYGTSAIKEKYPDARFIANPKLAKNIASGSGAGSVFPEISPLLNSGLLQQFHMMLPKEGKDAPFGGFISFPDFSGFVMPTVEVSEGQVLTIDGVDLQFFTNFNVDSDDQLLVWMPARKIVLNNAFWGFMPNMYSLRGSNFRDPENITQALFKIRDLGTEIMLSTHGMPVVGKQQVKETVETYADFYNFVKDQTLRAMLLGRTPQDLGKFLKLPKHFTDAEYLCETYGPLESFAESIYHHGRGWFDNDAANIFKLTREDEATNLIKAIGGADRVLQLSDQANKDGDQIWALKLINYLYVTDPTNQVYRTKKAQLLYQMGMVLESQNARSWCLTQAYALTGKIKVPRLVLPDMIVNTMSTTTLLSQYKVRIDPEKAGTTNYLLACSIDNAKTVGLHCRFGVVEYIDDLDGYATAPNATLSMTRSSLVDLFLNKRPVGQVLADQSTVVRGNKQEVERFLSYFDEVFSAQVNQHIPFSTK
jgi:alkyl sulfatase BDS1-like metallo-beta-lactamase superfamily hydrolase